MSLDNVKTLLINQGDVGELCYLSSDRSEEVCQHLTLAEIEGVTNNRAFCLGVVDPNTCTVDYTKFQRQYQLLVSAEGL